MKSFDIVPTKKTIHNDLLCDPCKKGRIHWGDCNYGMREGDWHFARERKIIPMREYL